jgi:plastocyanin
MRTPRATASTLVVALLLAGCAGDEAEVVEEGQPDAETTVVVREFAFQESTALLEPDTRVTWDNQDSVDHTVTSGTPNEPTGVFDEELPAGGEVTILMDEPDTYPYYCRIHPNMVAELVVEPALS